LIFHLLKNPPDINLTPVVLTESFLSIRLFYQVGAILIRFLISKPALMLIELRFICAWPATG